MSHENIEYARRILSARSIRTLLAICLTLLTATPGFVKLAVAEDQWTDTYRQLAWPTSAAACSQGEVEPRIAAWRAAYPGSQHRYQAVTANEFDPDNDSECDYVIERRVGIVWV